MIDPASFTVLRRARESAQSVEPTTYDAPPGEPDIYEPSNYPPGFGPNAQSPAKQFQTFPLTLAATARARYSVPWEAEYFYYTLDGTAACEVAAFSSDAVTARFLGLVGPGGHAKIPLSGLKSSEIWLVNTTAAVAARGIAAFTAGVEYENFY